MKVIEKKLGIHIPEVLLPNRGIDLKKWSVVACDQYTSQVEYWKQVENFIGGNPSTLDLIFPEVYLEEKDSTKRIDKINKAMGKYIAENILVKKEPGFIYIDRKTSHAVSRKGLIIGVDLEKYDYGKGSQTLIRATEGTVIDRLPPRIRIRENAPIELPHIMLLIDDPGKTVIEPLSYETDRMEQLYDFELMMNGGHIKGYMVNNAETLMSILKAFDNLANPSGFMEKYGVRADSGVLLFAAGDGNHSLASAKGHWENIKKNLSIEDQENHPARYALVEVVNVHDDGLKFEPIHRIVFNVNTPDLLEGMLKYYKNSKPSLKMYSSKEKMFEGACQKYEFSGVHQLPFIAGGECGIITVEKPRFNLAVGTLQAFLDEYVGNTGIKIDYIHGDDVVSSLGAQKGNIGFYLPPMDKNDLFKTVILDGVLPRKTFSMGEADEKRYYLECRKIR